MIRSRLEPESENDGAVERVIRGGSWSFAAIGAGYADEPLGSDMMSQSTGFAVLLPYQRKSWNK